MEKNQAELKPKKPTKDPKKSLSSGIRRTHLLQWFHVAAQGQRAWIKGGGRWRRGVANNSRPYEPHL